MPLASKRLMAHFLFCSMTRYSVLSKRRHPMLQERKTQSSEGQLDTVYFAPVNHYTKSRIAYKYTLIFVFCPCVMFVLICLI